LSLITVANLSKSYGTRDVFSGVSFDVPAAARIALVGINGVGKTTLLRILVGEELPTSGEVRRARGTRLGYLPQGADLTGDRTLWEECQAAFAPLRAQEAKLAQLENEMAKAQGDEDLLQRYGALQEAFERAGGYHYDTRIRQVLSGLGFEEGDHHQPLRVLSGGQRTRALLARVLLEAPDLLVLDEPTNHLDVKAIEWLEGYLNDWKGAVLLVSHDRYLLDKVADTILEMRPGGFERYRGNYSAYLKQRVERWEQRRQFAEAELERLYKELDYIRRNIAGQRTQQAKGKLSRLSRQIRAIEEHGFAGVEGKKWSEIGTAGRAMRVEEAAQRLKALEAPRDQLPNLHVSMQAKTRSGEIVLRAKALEIGYPGKPLFTVDKLELRRCEFAALLGPNGAGKTTFLRTILGQLSPLAGELKLGASLEVGYSSQGHEGLDPELTLMEEIERTRPDMLMGEVRSYLGRFLFSGDEHFKKVAVLSGGERSRLALAKLALTDTNFLLLDEPTNHLDIPSQEVIQAMLSEYQGTVLLITHDRYLVDALATQIWEIDPGSRTLSVFHGGYSQYSAEKETRLAEEGAGVKFGSSPDRVAATKRERGESQWRRWQRLQALEERITALEAELGAIANRLENPPKDRAEVEGLSRAYGRLESDLQAALQEWESLHELAD